MSIQKSELVTRFYQAHHGEVSRYSYQYNTNLANNVPTQAFNRLQIGVSNNQKQSNHKGPILKSYTKD